MMDFKILNGILFCGGKRVILRHVNAYEGGLQTVAITCGDKQHTFNVGSNAPALMQLLDSYFSEAK